MLCHDPGQGETPDPMHWLEIFPAYYPGTRVVQCALVNACSLPGAPGKMHSRFHARNIITGSTRRLNTKPGTPIRVTMITNLRGRGEHDGWLSRVNKCWSRRSASQSTQVPMYAKKMSSICHRHIALVKLHCGINNLWNKFSCTET